ncbi:MAG: PaaI family thioesterase [Gammaproteobacteria bacterium]
MQDEANEKPWHLSDISIGEPPEATPEYLLRRRIGTALKEITERMIRADMPENVLEEIAAQLESVSARSGEYKRRSQMRIYERLFARTATRQDVLDILDYEIFTGLSTPISPPMTLWLDGDLVRGRANLGLTFQGPPGRVHGGVIAAMLDVLMAKTQDISKTMGVTGTLNIRYIKGTPINTDIDMEARILRIDGRKLFCEGRFFVNGEQTVHAEGVWIAMREWQ